MQTRRMALLGAFAFCLSACGTLPSGESVEPHSTLGRADTPNFSIASGTYSSSQSVAIISDTPGAVIYYTSDGSDPTTSSRVYGGPVSVTTNLTLEALAVAKGYTQSNVASATYSFDSNYQPVSGLPIPARSGVPRFVGAPGGLKVLNWAGFEGAITYTFDDSGQADEYPQLRATGQKMTFFLTCAWDNSSPVWLQAAKDGQELGNHTQHHCLADGHACAGGPFAGTTLAEYDLCTEHLKQTFGVPNVWTTAAPYGDTGYDSVARTRFFLNRGVNGGHVSADGGANPYHLPVHDPHTGEKASTLNSFVDAAVADGYWRIFMFHSLKHNGGKHYVDIAELVANINYAKSTGNVWIDTMANVGAYWMGQEALEDAKETQSPDAVILKWQLPSHFPSGKYLRVTLTGGTLKQGGTVIPWNDAGFYEIALDPGSLTISP